MWHEVHPRYDDKYKTVIGTIVSHFLFDLIFFVLVPLPPIGGFVMGSNTWESRWPLLSAVVTSAKLCLFMIL
jgi:hypothetical protein